MLFLLFHFIQQILFSLGCHSDSLLTRLPCIFFRYSIWYHKCWWWITNFVVSIAVQSTINFNLENSAEQWYSCPFWHLCLSWKYNFQVIELRVDVSLFEWPNSFTWKLVSSFTAAHKHSECWWQTEEKVLWQQEGVLAALYHLLCPTPGVGKYEQAVSSLGSTIESEDWHPLKIFYMGQ